MPAELLKALGAKAKMELATLNALQISSSEYDVTSVFRKIFLTKWSTVVIYSLLFFNCSVADDVYRRKSQKFCLNSGTRTIHY